MTINETPAPGKTFSYAEDYPFLRRLIDAVGRIEAAKLIGSTQSGLSGMIKRKRVQVQFEMAAKAACIDLALIGQPEADETAPNLPVPAESKSDGGRAWVIKVPAEHVPHVRRFLDSYGTDIFRLRVDDV